MIRSMTGFGRFEVIDELEKIIIEIKAVNHRYSDMSIKLPRKLNRFEVNVRNFLKEYIQRGKVDIYITYEDYASSNVVVKYNKDVAKEYCDYFDSMAKEFDIPNNVTTTILGKMSEVFILEEQIPSDDLVWDKLKEVLEKATLNFVTSRETEGENLKADLLSKLSEMKEMVLFIEQKSPEVIEEYKIKLVEKINDLTNNALFDEQRIATEVTMFADKVCVDEEIVRLKSHIDQTTNILTAGGAVGRKLDFIVQEMNREANTILSKSTSLQVSDVGINLKTLIEKVREQVQNIE